QCSPTSRPSACGCRTRCTAADKKENILPTPTQRPALASSQTGIATSPHTLATEAGLAILRDGGNAVEAAIAMGACLTVTYPHFTGLGGDAFMIIADASGHVRTLSGIGQAPRARLDLTDG